MAQTFQVKFEVTDDGKVVAKLDGITAAALAGKPAVKALSDELAKSDSAAKDAGDRWAAVGEKIGSAFAYIGAAGVAGLALVARNSIAAEQELAQLDAVLKSTGQSADYSRARLLDMADEIAKSSRIFSGGDIVRAQTRLLSYSGVVSTNFRDALQVAIDQSARLGISVEQSAEVVGRALEKPTKAAAALAQQGFGAAFTPAVMKSIKALEDSGHAAEAQRVILDILQESYAGAAEAAGRTFGGALTGLKNTLSDLTTGADGSLDGATASVNALTETLSSEQTKSAFAAITGWVAELASELLGGVAQFGQWIARTRELQGLATGGPQSSASLESLNERLGQATQERAQMQSWRSNAFGLPLSEDQSKFRQQELTRLDNERIALQREITKRLNAENFAGVTATVDSTAAKPLTGDVAGPDKEAQRKAERIKRAMEAMGAAQREWQTDLKSVGNPALDEYAKRLDTITEKAGAFARAGVPAERIKAFTAEMQALATQIRDKELAQFQKEFTADTAEMAAQLGGPGVAAAREYTRAMAEVQKLLDAGAITTEQYAARQQALQDKMNGGAIRLLRDIADERQALFLNAQQLEVYNNLKSAGVDANSAYGKSIIQATQQLQQDRTTAAFIGDLKSATADFAVSLASDFGKAGDAAEQFGERIKRMALQLLAEKAVQYIFGSVLGGAASAYTGNGTGAGSMGGFGSEIGGFTFGGGRAVGGQVQSDRIYEVTEGGMPELLRQGNRTFLLPGSDGVVIPAGDATGAAPTRLGSGGAAPAVNVNVYGAAGTPQVQTSMGEDGALNIDMIFDQVDKRAAAGVANGNSSLYRGIKQRFGLRETV
ncbi:hypothetical protein DYQ93_11460 [Xanthomonas sp. LMG 8992]|uniref:phage tail length tape measure family protein n=1 Tax=Xanthomonas sp. LMG 8992 TaxID=1591157 RepID=UPI00136E8149|nr:phage tail length tape measure family protein [Xanthomonas sp. LMG 8992]MXV11637.1 hypothetical protein [Xanthomonas sp. LMG 8992]